MSSYTSGKAFEHLVAGLDSQKIALTEKRRTFTKNLVAQTNDEARSGIPYVVDVSDVIRKANGAELFIDNLVNFLRLDSREYGESIALRKALASVMKKISELDPENGTPDMNLADLSDIGLTLISVIAEIELRVDG